MTERQPVGFDLDGTLIDSRPQILASFRALAQETRVPIDIEEIDARLGLKLEDELEHWFGPAAITEAAEIYRRHYVTKAPETLALPGARDALDAVRSFGVRSAIITAKHKSTVDLCIDAAGLQTDEVFPFVHGLEKAEVLRRIGAAVYVGDSLADMTAALAGGSMAIGVATGSSSEAQLKEAGAAVTLASLEEFPPWYRAWLSS